MSETAIVGVKPWLPWPLRRWPWWTDAIRAERLAALRIGVASVLLLDILVTYLPRASLFFGADSLRSAHGFEDSRTGFPWSLAGYLDDPRLPTIGVSFWAAVSVLLLIGAASRLSACVAWVLSQVFFNLNPYVHNAGDTVRTIILFYLVLSPCGAAWSVDRWLRRSRSSRTATTFIHPWPVRLLMVQLVVIYFFNGAYKFMGPQWRAGTTLHYVLADLSIARFSYAQLAAPFWLTQLLTWTVLAWELVFPLLVVLRPTRMPALLMGVFMHLGIGLTMELGLFAPYMLCMYLPWVRCETTVDGIRGRSKSGRGTTT
jgi:hypothetical protein